MTGTSADLLALDVIIPCYNVQTIGKKPIILI